jgi:hypothetical protein
MEVPVDKTKKELELDNIDEKKEKSEKKDEKNKVIENPDRFNASNKQHEWKKGGNHFETCLHCKHNTGLRATSRCRRCFYHVHAEPCQANIEYVFYCFRLILLI